MDSGNSDSFQSSNGGDEEYNSRGGGDSISAFINQAATRASGGLIYNTPPHQSTNHSMFNPIISNYQNLQNNLEMVWSEPLRSDPNSTETNNPLSSHQHFTVQNSNIPSSSSVQEMMNNTSSRNSSLLPNPKKRSRASRRAPTTVLTTDTTNFRAMVQEFTGIPAPPFTSSTSSLFSRNSRLDNLFGTTSSLRSNSNNNNPLDNYSISLSSQPASYLSRPFPQKFQPSSSSSMFSASMVDSLRTNVDDSYQRLQSSNLFTMQNPILASLLQSNPSNPTLSHNLSVFGSKTHHGSGGIQSSNGFQVEGNNNASLGALPGLVSADPARWGGVNGGANGGFGNNNGGGDDLAINVGNGKRQKGMMEDGGVGARSEGMMETWICSSSE